MHDVGRRMRKVRESHGLSQRQLARRSGVSNATISLIEHARTDPSLGILKRILDAIPVSIGDFFAMEMDTSDKVFYGRDELAEIAGGAVSYRQVGGDLRAHRLQILHERYRPGADTGRALLTHDAEEGGVVIQGHLELTVGEQTRVLGPGDAYLFNSRIPHRFRCVGSEECIVVSACTPPSF